MASTNVLANSKITFLEGSIKTSGTITGIRDEFHLNLSLSDGRNLTNVPHMGMGRHLGWYVANPAETRSVVNATTYQLTL